MDISIMRKLFLQRLPSNFCMTVTLSAGVLNLDQLADCIMEASPTLIVAATESTTANFIIQVNDLSKHLTSTLSSAINNLSRHL